MSDLNKVILIGRLARDPEKRLTIAGEAVVRFTIAVNRPPDKEGVEKADFIDIVAFRQIGESVSANLTKGSQVCVEGRLQIREFTTQDGQKRKVAEIIANKVQFLARAREELREIPEQKSVTEPEEIQFESRVDLGEEE